MGIQRSCITIMSKDNVQVTVAALPMADRKKTIRSESLPKVVSYREHHRSISMPRNKAAAMLCVYDKRGIQEQSRTESSSEAYSESPDVSREHECMQKNHKGS